MEHIVETDLIFRISLPILYFRTEGVGRCFSRRSFDNTQQQCCLVQHTYCWRSFVSTWYSVRCDIIFPDQPRPRLRYGVPWRAVNRAAGACHGATQARMTDVVGRSAIGKDLILFTCRTCSCSTVERLFPFRKPKKSPAHGDQAVGSRHPRNPQSHHPAAPAAPFAEHLPLGRSKVGPAGSITSKCHMLHSYLKRGVQIGCV